MFGSRALAVESGEQFRKDPLRYKPVGWTTEATLRMRPPRTPEMKSSGNLLSPVYKELDVGERRGVLRPSYPRFGDPRAELSIPLESGLLKHVAVLLFENVQGERVVKCLEVDADVPAATGMDDRLAAAAGVRPVPMGGVSRAHEVRSCRWRAERAESTELTCGVESPTLVRWSWAHGTPAPCSAVSGPLVGVRRPSAPSRAPFLRTDWLCHACEAPTRSGKGRCGICWCGERVGGETMQRKWSMGASASRRICQQLR